MHAESSRSDEARRGKLIAAVIMSDDFSCLSHRISTGVADGVGSSSKEAEGRERHSPPHERGRPA